MAKVLSATQYPPEPFGPDADKPGMILAMCDDGNGTWITADSDWGPWLEYLAEGGTIEEAPPDGV